MNHDLTTQQKKSFGKKRADSQSHNSEAAAAYYQPNALQKSFNSRPALNYPEPVNDDNLIIQYTDEQLNQIASILDSSNLEHDSIIARSNNQEREFSHARQAAAAYYQPNALQKSFNSRQPLNYPEVNDDNTTIHYTGEQLNQIASILDSSNLELDSVIAHSKDQESETKVQALTQHLTAELANFQTEEQKLYSCDICQKKYTCKCTLTVHQRIHTDEKPYSCDTCKKKFNHKSDLTRHQLSHTGEKPYWCDLCDKKFTRKGDVTRHQLSHTGEKPYWCDFCGKKFARKESLKAHLNRHRP